MESLDSILADLQKKHTAPSDRQDANNADVINARAVSVNPDLLNLAIEPKPNSIDRLLADLRQPEISANSAPLPEDIQVLASVPQDCAQKISEAAITADLQQVAALQSAKEQQAKSEAAQKWLQALDPLSSEGLWFAEFAQNYDSHLEAAIALLSN